MEVSQGGRREWRKAHYAQMSSCGKILCLWDSLNGILQLELRWLLLPYQQKGRAQGWVNPPGRAKTKHFGFKSNILMISKPASSLCSLQVSWERVFSARAALLYLPPSSLCQSVTWQCHGHHGRAATVSLSSEFTTAGQPRAVTCPSCGLEWLCSRILGGWRSPLKKIKSIKIKLKGKGKERKL